MDERELHELRDPASWEADGDDLRPPVKSPRAVVSVAFSREDLERVAGAARASGMRTSEFIRHAALRCPTPAGEPPTGRITSISGASGFRANYPAATSTSTTPESKVKGPPGRRLRDCLVSVPETKEGTCHIATYNPRISH